MMWCRTSGASRRGWRGKARGSVAQRSSGCNVPPYGRDGRHHPGAIRAGEADGVGAGGEAEAGAGDDHGRSDLAATRIEAADGGDRVSDSQGMTSHGGEKSYFHDRPPLLAAVRDTGNGRSGVEEGEESGNSLRHHDVVQDAGRRFRTKSGRASRRGPGSTMGKARHNSMKAACLALYVSQRSQQRPALRITSRITHYNVVNNVPHYTPQESTEHIPSANRISGGVNGSF